MTIGYWVIARKRTSADEPNTGGFWVYCGPRTGVWVTLSEAQAGAGKTPFFYKSRKNANDAVKRLRVKMYASFSDFTWRGPVDVRSRRLVGMEAPLAVRGVTYPPHGGNGDL